MGWRLAGSVATPPFSVDVPPARSQVPYGSSAMASGSSHPPCRLVAGAESDLGVYVARSLPLGLPLPPHDGPFENSSAQDVAAAAATDELRSGTPRKVLDLVSPLLDLLP